MKKLRRQILTLFIDDPTQNKQTYCCVAATGQHRSSKQFVTNICNHNTITPSSTELNVFSFLFLCSYDVRENHTFQTFHRYVSNLEKNRNIITDANTWKTLNRNIKLCYYISFTLTFEFSLSYLFIYLSMFTVYYTVPINLYTYTYYNVLFCNYLLFILFN